MKLYQATQGFYFLFFLLTHIEHFFSPFSPEGISLWARFSNLAAWDCIRKRKTLIGWVQRTTFYFLSLHQQINFQVLCSFYANIYANDFTGFINASITTIMVALLC